MRSIYESERQSSQKRKFHKKWDNIFEYKKDGSLTSIIDHLKFLDSKKEFSQYMVTLNNFDEMKAIYVSTGVSRLFGYSPQEYLDEEHFFYRGGTHLQPGYLLDTVRCVKHFQDLGQGRPATDVLFISGGVSFQHKDGTQRRVISILRVVKIEGGTMPHIGIMVHHDVTELMKGDNYWIYQEMSLEDSRLCRFYEKDNIENHFVSQREQEVLRLIAKGHSSRSIAEELGISTATVSQHRKNMLKRTNSKDTSALIQICKICEIL